MYVHDMQCLFISAEGTLLDICALILDVYAHRMEPNYERVTPLNRISGTMLRAIECVVCILVRAIGGAAGHVLRPRAPGRTITGGRIISLELQDCRTFLVLSALCNWPVKDGFIAFRISLWTSSFCERITDGQWNAENQPTWKPIPQRAHLRQVQLLPHEIQRTFYKWHLNLAPNFSVSTNEVRLGIDYPGA